MTEGFNKSTLRVCSRLASTVSKTKVVPMTSREMYLASTDAPIVQGRESESVERSGERWTGPVNVNVKK